MSLMKLQGELPKDAIFLTESEALQYQWKLVQDWKNPSETLPLRYGFAVSGFCSGVAGFYFNNHYRVKLKLRKFGKLSSYIPNVVLPTFIGSFMHMQFVTSDLLLHKTECPLCVEVRAIAIQTLFGFIYPIILSPLAGFVNANNYLTYDIPSLRYPTKVIKLFWKMTKPISTNLGIMLAFQAVGASLLTYQEAKALHKIETDLIKKETHRAS